MSLPSLEAVYQLMKAGDAIKTQILEMARKLEELNEYNSDQALIVAADIVRSKWPANEAADFVTQNQGVVP